MEKLRHNGIHWTTVIAAVDDTPWKDQGNVKVLKNLKYIFHLN